MWFLFLLSLRLWVVNYFFLKWCVLFIMKIIICESSYWFTTVVHFATFLHFHLKCLLTAFYRTFNPEYSSHPIFMFKSIHILSDRVYIADFFNLSKILRFTLAQHTTSFIYFQLVICTREIGRFIHKSIVKCVI